MSVLDTVRSKIIGIVKDDSAKLINPDDYDLKIAEALNIYSKHRPDIAVDDIPGDGGHDYDFPDEWVEGFSEIKSVEYPLGYVPETLLDADSYYVYQNTTKKQIRLVEVAPAATETFRVTFTIPRTIASILETDEDAFCRLGAALCLEDLANAFAQTGDSIINADSVNYRAKSGEFSARAKRCMSFYNKHIGIKNDDTTTAASSVMNMEMNYPGGSDRLTHPKWARRRR
jgi:hypothetical protein